MKKTLIVMCIVALVAPAFAQADPSSVMNEISKKYSGAMGVLTCVVKDPVSKDNQAKGILSGPAVCVTKDGIFMTQSIDPRMRTDLLTDFGITLPGNEPKRLAARLMGIDPLTGISFVQVVGDRREWPAVPFIEKAGATIGQQVYSLGLIMEPGYPVTVSTGYVSAALRTPEQLVYVSGKLGAPGSLVFSSDGKAAIGIVGRQMFMNYQVMANQGQTATMQMKSQEESSFFTPVDEFVYIFSNIPSDGKVRRMSWLGINQFTVLYDPEVQKINNVKGLGIKIDQVVEGYPAALAGMSKLDIITAINGQPIEKLATPDLTLSDFNRKLLRLPAREKVKITAVRAGETREFSLTLVEMPTLPSEAPVFVEQYLGFAAREKVLLDEYIGDAATAKVKGLVVVGVGENSMARQAGLQNLDLIISINDKQISKAEEIKKIIEEAFAKKPPEAITLIVQRGDIKVPVKMVFVAPAARP